jgi:pimeloyl-ACP methyl ester carboxylesterase
MIRFILLNLFTLSVLYSSAKFNHAQLNSDTNFVETILELATPDGPIFGTLLTPETSGNIPVAIIVSGSGPTDRNGNSMMTNNNSLKKLAEALASKRVASLRFDKRGVGKSMRAIKSEAALRFEDYIMDVRGWVRLLKKDKRFTKVIIIGHSEGSLIGMAAADSADMFISLAGSGRKADDLIREQLSRQPQQIKEASLPILESLAQGKKVDSVPPALAALFRPSVQPYLISWFKYNPAEIIREMKIPVLIVQGENDLQVSVKDANLLAEANLKARLVLIPHMNHVLKNVGDDNESNMKTYRDPDLPIKNELVEAIDKFIQQN